MADAHFRFNYLAYAYTTTDSLGRTITYTGSDISSLSSGTDNKTVTYTSYGAVSSVTADGLTWNYSFTPSGTVITNPDSSTRTVVSDATLGMPTSITDELGHTTTYTYYTNGLLHTSTAPEGNQVQYTMMRAAI